MFNFSQKYNIYIMFLKFFDNIFDDCDNKLFFSKLIY